MPRAVGVVTIQGDFQKHILALIACGVKPGDIRPLRSSEDLDGVERAIIPGGESTTVGKLMERFGLGPALIEAAKKGMPLWGTCTGMILMAKDIEGRPDQYRLGMLDIGVIRNAFGAQVYSFEAPVEVSVLDKPFLGVFIRAPLPSRIGKGVESIAKLDERIVGVRQGNLIATSFHPELTNDTRFHKWFLGL
jgi:5'-phosphate synthase pdxT subunit